MKRKPKKQTLYATIKGSEWRKMSAKTKAAMVAMLRAVTEAVEKGQL